jgi:hypothetical protein
MKYMVKRILLAAVQVSLLGMTTDLIAQSNAPSPARPATPQAQGLQPLPTPVDAQSDWVTKFFELKYADAANMKTILSIFRADFVVPNVIADGRFRIIGVRAPKEIMPAIEETIARFDVPPPTPVRAPVKSIEVSVQVLGAYDGAAPNCPTCVIPPSLQPVITQLQKTFTYKTYSLLDTQLYRQTDGTSLNTVNSLAAIGDNSATYTISWSQVNASADTIILYSLKFGADVYVSARGQITHFGFDTSPVRIPADQQIVIGKTSVGTATVFLVIRAKLLD